MNLKFLIIWLWLAVFAAGCGNNEYSTIRDGDIPSSLYSIPTVDSIHFESVSDPTGQFELRHYILEARKDSLFIFQNDTCIYKFNCEVEDEDMGYFVENGISFVDENGEVLTGDMLAVDSILFIPITMSFNGWVRIFTYDLETGREVFHSVKGKEFDIWDRGHTYIKNGSVFCLQGIQVDEGSVKWYKIKNGAYVLQEIKIYQEQDYIDSVILRDIMRNG